MAKLPRTPKFSKGKLEPFELNVPHDFEKSLGCLIVTRYLAFYLDENGDVLYDNGVLEDLVDMSVWTKWTTCLKDFEKSKCEKSLATLQEPYVALLLDTHTRAFFAVPEIEAREFLYQYYARVTGLPYI